MSTISDESIKIPTDRIIVFDRSRKVPTARFYEDISEVVDGKLELIGPTLRAFNEVHKKFHVMTQSLVQQLEGLEDRKKNLEDALDAIEATKERTENSTVLYKVSDCLYTRARITEPKKCLLWLGYTPEEAEDVIKANLKTTEENIDEITDSLLQLREETTVIEAAMSRLHNYGVHLRQKL